MRITDLTMQILAAAPFTAAHDDGDDAKVGHVNPDAYKFDDVNCDPEASGAGTMLSEGAWDVTRKTWTDIRPADGHENDDGGDRNDTATTAAKDHNIHYDTDMNTNNIDRDTHDGSGQTG